MLDEICREFRIDRQYWDIWGNRHETSDSTIQAILRSFGLRADGNETMAEAYRRHLEQQQRRLLDPVTVLSAAAAEPAVRIRVPDLYLRGTIASALVAEDGAARRWKLAVERLPGGGGNNCLLPLPLPLPAGYYDLEVVLRQPGQPELRATQRVVAAPDRAHLPESLRDGGRIAGLAISLYGVRSARNWGVGDFTDLEALARWAASRLRVSMLALNPLHALHNREPFNTSPYLPLSSFYRNYLYLDVERVLDFEHARAARRIVSSPRFQAELARLRDSESVEYESVARLKRGILRLVFREFLRRHWMADTTRARAFRRWREAEGDRLDRFATYCALDEVLHARDRNVWIWPGWPEPYRDPESAAVGEFRKLHWRRILFHEWVQWQIDLQLERAQQGARDAGMEIGLYHDLALATDRCGADLWAYRPFFVEGCRVGSPPDDFSPDGQDWAFPPPQPETHRQDGYRLFVDSIRKNTRHGGALRIDHVMRFFRLFWIPEGMPAREGTYVQEPWEELVRILALESVRGRFLVVGEDLGTCPPEIRESMRQFGLLSYKLFYFEKGPDGMPRRTADYEREALVSSTTHDLPTLAGFWAGRDIEARWSAGLLPDKSWYERQMADRQAEKRNMIEALIRDGFLPADFPREAAGWTGLTGDLHSAVIGALVSTPSMIMLLNQEDLTKETEQQNLPGTTTEYPNWKRKMRLSLEQLEGEEAAGFVNMFRSWLERTGRAAGASAPGT